MFGFMQAMSVLLKDFGHWTEQRTQRIRQASAELAEAASRPVIYLHSSRVRKESLALDIAAADRVSEGLICVLTCVEPCLSFRVGPNREQRRLELRYGPMKCLHHYFYLLDANLGLTHLRLQTWAPYTVQVCFNGREWLARQLMARGIAFEQRDNCFVNIADVACAQALLAEQLRTDWSGLLDGLLRRVHPTHAHLFGRWPQPYYWSADETEWATDVMFRSRASLARLYQRLTRHAMTTFGSQDVLRFLGRTPQVRRYRKAEITSHGTTRPEGTRIKHTHNRNSVKMYDKQETVLRVETTINDPRDLKVLRPKEGEPQGGKRWRPLRKGVADLHRRAQISQKSNERYLEALSTVDDSAALGETVRPLCQATRWKGRRVRGLQPLAPPDAALLAAIARGEFQITGFRNRDLRGLLFGNGNVAPAEAKRQAAKITRLIRMLRAHHLIQKVPKTHRYQLTRLGRTTVTAINVAQAATIKALAQLAA
jgi:hypothetical protein